MPWVTARDGDTVLRIAAQHGFRLAATVSCSYSFEVGSATLEGTTTGAGLIDVAIPLGERTAKLWFHDEAEVPSPPAQTSS